MQTLHNRIRAHASLRPLDRTAYHRTKRSPDRTGIENADVSLREEVRLGGLDRSDRSAEVGGGVNAQDRLGLPEEGLQHRGCLRNRWRRRFGKDWARPEPIQELCVGQLRLFQEGLVSKDNDLVDEPGTALLEIFFWEGRGCIGHDSDGVAFLDHGVMTLLDAARGGILRMQGRGPRA